MDPYPDGRGYRGWADRLAERLAAVEPGLLYANLAVRGKLARQIREEQLDAALALRPDLCTVSGGLNDVLRRHCDLDTVLGHLDAIIGTLRGAGADVLCFTYPNRVPTHRVAHTAHARVATFNARLRDLAARHGAMLVDFEAHPVTSDARLWHPDRLHANSLGHERIAAALAHGLGLPDTDTTWSAPLPRAARVGRPRALAGHAEWAGRHLGPWVVRRLRGVSSGDGRHPKRPELSPVVVPTPRSPAP
jgi:lysophospholipase L1-like esterase